VIYGMRLESSAQSGFRHIEITSVNSNLSRRQCTALLANAYPMGQLIRQRIETSVTLIPLDLVYFLHQLGTH